MNLSKTINYILIIVGGIIAIYAQAREEQNQYILIGGIVILMLGIYRISRNIPSKFEDSESTKNENEE